MRTLFLHPPSFDGFDGGAGARYQAKRGSAPFGSRRGLRSLRRWCGSKLIDAPADGTRSRMCSPRLRLHLVIMHTSAPSS